MQQRPAGWQKSYAEYRNKALQKAQDEWDSEGGTAPSEDGSGEVVVESSYASPAFSAAQPIWKLKSTEVLKAKMQGPMPGKNVYSMLRSAGVSEEELKWTGLSKALNTQDKVTLEQLLAIIQDNAPQLEEKRLTEGIKYNRRSPYATTAVQRFFAESLATDMEDLELEFSNDGDIYRSLSWNPRLRERDGSTRPDWYNIVLKSLNPQVGNSTRYKEYATEGGEDYSELLLKGKFAKGRDSLPFTHPHWRGEEGVAGHLRTQVFKTTDRKKLLLLEEIQSDLYQEMREAGVQGTELPEGYTAKDVTKSGGASSWVVLNPEGKVEGYFASSEEEAVQGWLEAHSPGFKEAPFQKTWMKLLFRRGLIEAIQKGCSYLGWTTGKQQADRYALDKYFSEASLRSESDKDFYLTLEDKSGHEIEPYSGSGKRVSDKEVLELLGSDLGGRLINGAIASRGKKARKGSTINPEFFTLKGEAVASGGHGMEKFYDEMVVNYANDIGKKFGVQVKEVGIVTGNEQIDLLVERNGNKFTVYTKRESYMNPQWIPLESFKTREEADAYVVSRRTSPSIHALPLPPELKEAFKDGSYLFQSANDETVEVLSSKEEPELLTPQLLLSLNFLGSNPFPYDDRGMWFTFKIDTSSDSYLVRGGLQPLSMILPMMMDYVHAPREAVTKVTREIAFPLDDVYNFSFEIVDSAGTAYRGDEVGGTVDDPELRSQASRIFSTAIEFLKSKESSVYQACVASYGSRNRLALYRRLFAQAGNFGGKLLKEFEVAGVSFALFGRQSFFDANEDEYSLNSSKNFLRQDGAAAAPAGSFTYGPSTSLPPTLMPRGASPRMVGTTFPGVKSRGKRRKQVDQGLWLGFTGKTEGGKDFAVFDDEDGDRVILRLSGVAPVDSPDDNDRPPSIVVREGGRAFKVSYFHNGDPATVKEIESSRDLALEKLLTTSDPGMVAEDFSKELTRKAIKAFGETYSPSEAGYILPDGTLLDFSGRNQGNTEGGRVRDHREVEGLDALTRKASEVGNRSVAMTNFMRRTGAARIDEYSSFIDIFKTPATPSREQVAYMSELYEGRPEVYITLRSTRANQEDKEYELHYPDRDEIRRVLLQGEF